MFFICVVVSERKKQISAIASLYYKFSYFQIFSNFHISFSRRKKKRWILSTSLAGNTETPKMKRNTNIPEDLGAVIYDITYVLKNFENDLKLLKIDTSKRKEKLERLSMVSLNKFLIYTREICNKNKQYLKLMKYIS